jgi:hypothetical protein
MAYSILDVTNDLGAMMHGQNTNQIVNLYGLYNRAARQVLLDVDPQETKRITPFVTPIYNQVFDYALPVDLKGNKIIDISPQVNRHPSDNWLQQYNQFFDQYKNWTFQDMFTVQFNSGLKTIRISAPNQSAPIPIDLATSPNDNGEWTAGGGATNLATDNVNWVVGGGSLVFDLAAGPSTGYLENSTLYPQDLSAYLNQATQFLYTYLPTASAVSAVELRFGSSASDYYALSTSVTQQNTVFQNGWNLLQYPWASMSVTGTPNSASITYCRVTWTYDGMLQTAVRLNDIVSTLGSILNLEYYSKYLFRDSVTGAFQEKVSADSNLINLDVESYPLYLNQVCFQAAQQLQGRNALMFDANYFAQQYNENLERYKGMYKSEISKPSSQYYAVSSMQYGTGQGRARFGY